MKYGDLKRLDGLLHEYMELMQKKAVQSEYSFGNKAQYNHARLISRKIEVLVGDNLPTGYSNGKKDNEVVQL